MCTFSLCGNKTMPAVFLGKRFNRETIVYKWKTTALLRGQGENDPENLYLRIKSTMKSVVKLRHEDGNKRTSRYSRRLKPRVHHSSISCLHFATQCGDISKSGEGSAAHNKSSSSCRGEEVPLPLRLRASVGQVWTYLPPDSHCSCSQTIRAIWSSTWSAGFGGSQ